MEDTTESTGSRKKARIDAPDTLVFYSKSADSPAPGKGVHENVGDPSEYTELKKIVGWRKVLSNFHVDPFVHKDGKTYMTIEHAFQAAKIALADPKKAELFTVESGDKIGLGDGKMAQSKRKLVKLTPDQLAVWDSMSENVMREAAIEKYKASASARDVLKKTNRAQLWHLMTQRGQQSKLVRFGHLEDIRNGL